MNTFYAELIARMAAVDLNNLTRIPSLQPAPENTVLGPASDDMKRLFNVWQDLSFEHDAYIVAHREAIHLATDGAAFIRGYNNLHELCDIAEQFFWSEVKGTYLATAKKNAYLGITNDWQVVSVPGEKKEEQTVITVFELGMEPFSLGDSMFGRRGSGSIFGSEFFMDFLDGISKRTRH